MKSIIHHKESYIVITNEQIENVDKEKYILKAQRKEAKLNINGKNETGNREFQVQIKPYNRTPHKSYRN